MNLEVVILAAGKGTRMCSNIPKVLHKVGNKELLNHMIEKAENLSADKIHIVYGYKLKFACGCRYSESLVKAKHTYAVVFIVFANKFKNLVFVFCGTYSEA